jgi:hypothetical protein
LDIDSFVIHWRDPRVHPRMDRRVKPVKPGNDAGEGGAAD